MLWAKGTILAQGLPTERMQALHSFCHYCTLLGAPDGQVSTPRATLASALLGPILHSRPLSPAPPALSSAAPTSHGAGSRALLPLRPSSLGHVLCVRVLLSGRVLHDTVAASLVDGPAAAAVRSAQPGKHHHHYHHHQHHPLLSAPPASQSCQTAPLLLSFVSRSPASLDCLSRLGSHRRPSPAPANQPSSHCAPPCLAVYMCSASKPQAASHIPDTFFFFFFLNSFVATCLLGRQQAEGLTGAT
ncbi:uncharacterized protein J3D65DRAFT_392299 [Phyllosticta citribraziliensis]|uniref:Uncharacterized protein n=1 Tax=Phyllosticta citribraziliensis TaxID=989973 RepID=A0ABR1LKZ0_9PEZI